MSFASAAGSISSSCRRRRYQSCQLVLFLSFSLAKTNIGKHGLSRQIGRVSRFSEKRAADEGVPFYCPSSRILTAQLTNKPSSTCTRTRVVSRIGFGKICEHSGKHVLNMSLPSAAAAAISTGCGDAHGSEADHELDAADQEAQGEEYIVQEEGDATILQAGNAVFYNKAQVVNRDISIAVVRQFIKERRRESMGGDAAVSCNESAGIARSDAEEAMKMVKKRLRGNMLAVRAAAVVAMNASRKTNGSSNGWVGGGDGSSIAESIMEKNYAEELHKLRKEEMLRQEGLDTSKENGDSARKDAENVEDSSKLQLHCPDIVICEALAASGLRAIRYAKEISGVSLIVANDSDKSAVEAIKRNSAHNGSAAEQKIIAHHEDARMLLMRHERCFDVVDIDPYGSPSIFLEPAIQAVNEGGLLCVTATDMAVLCGSSGEACWAKYGSYPVKAKYCHEYAVRTLLQAIESAANRYKRHIVPVISLSIDFYVRVFVRIYTSPSVVKLSASKMSYVYQAVACDSFYLQPVAKVGRKNGSTKYSPALAPTVPERCPETGKRYYIGGPIWSDPIHDMGWVRNMLKDVQTNRLRYPGYDKVHACLVAVSEELADVPLYVTIHSMASTLKCEPPNVTLFRSAIINAGYRVSISHASALAVKTDAPMEVLWDIMRCWVKEHPIKNKEKYSETPGGIILSKEPTIKANWARASGAVSSAKEKKIPRFIPNPTTNWGPMSRAGRDNNEKDRGKTKKQRFN